MRFRARYECLLAVFAVCASWTAPGSARAEEGAEPQAHTFDHLVLAISDLDAGNAYFAELTGVEPTFGGAHPHLGTHNSLAALGPDSYVEIIAPRPGAESSPMSTWIGSYAEATPILWAVATRDAAATRAELKAAGFETSEPQPGSRETPDGRKVEWASFGLSSPQLAAAPFFLQWGASTRHPATTSPGGCSLSRLEVVSNDNAVMKRLLATLGVEAEVVDGEQPALRATLECPTGVVELGAPG